MVRTCLQRAAAAVLLVAIAVGSIAVTTGLGRIDAGLPDADLVTAAGWALRLTAAWLAVAVLASVVAAAGSSHPRPMAARCTLADRLAPAALRRLAVVAMHGGVVAGLLGAPVAVVVSGTASASVTAGRGHVTPRPGDHRRSPLSLDWPGTTVPPVRAPEVAPALARPRDRRVHTSPPVTVSSRPASATSSVPVTVRSAPGPAAPVPARVPAEVATKVRSATRGAGGSVVVAPGDSLWSIAAAHLHAGASAAEITAAWHAWWRVNRTVIGADPGIIRPGQRLAAPASAPAAR